MQPRPMAETVGPRRPSCRRWMVMRAIIECGAGPGKAAIAAHGMAHARRLSHVDRRGRARMVDVSPKPVTRREAVARGEVRMRAATLAQIAAGALPKGDALAVARLAGIMAAKRTADLVPLCHPLPLAHVEIGRAHV